jgi:hypothetical protein
VIIELTLSNLYAFLSGMSSQLAWEVVPTPRVEKSPPSRHPLQTPVLQKPKPTAVQENVLTKSDLLFIKDLNPAEKSKIALMIQQVCH